VREASQPGGRSAPRRGRRRHEDEDDTPVVGLGDHTPDFLLRPVFPDDKPDVA
jgi:hypothetical protein